MTMTLAVSEAGPEAVWSERLSEAAKPGAEPEAWAALRRQAGAWFERQGFPTTRDEEWRFTPVSTLVRTPFRLSSGAVAAEIVTAASELVRRLDWGEGHLAVFLDGVFRPEMGRLDGLPAGVTVAGIAAAAHEAEEEFGRHADLTQRPFAALAGALFHGGALVRVAARAVVPAPIRLLFLTSARAEPSAVFCRHLVVCGAASQASIVEHHFVLGDGAPTWSNSISEIVLGDGAVLDHYKLQREPAQAFHTALQHSRLGRGANFSSHSMNFGAALARHDVHCVLAGEGADATLNGLYLVEGAQHCDTHMRVEHQAPRCGSHELYKGILDGRGRAVFNGRIYVHRGAQKTDAKQTNRNLLLSREALVNTNPQLEIFADDVKCTHGSTVGQLDADAVFYLRSRGIGELAAKSLLTYAFASDIVSRVRVEPLRRELEDFLFGWLPMGEVVRDAV
jgi:Fe-S cluster assembly protein SufD